MQGCAFWVLELKIPPGEEDIGILVHESYAKCNERLVGLIDNDDDVFYLILFYYNHFTQKSNGSVRERYAFKYAQSQIHRFKSLREHLFFNVIIVSEYLL